MNTEIFYSYDCSKYLGYLLFTCCMHAELTGEVRKPVTDRIIEAGQLYLDGSDKSRDAAAYMLSRFMTRPDVKKHKFPEFLDWCLPQLARAKSGDSMLAFIFPVFASSIVVL